MKQMTAAIDRVAVLLLGVVLTGGGAFALAWHYDVPVAVDTLSRFDRRQTAELPFQQWWPTALLITAIVATVVSIALLIGNLSPRRTGTLQISSTDSLAVRVDLGALARGVAADLADFPGVVATSSSAIDDRGTATLAVTARTTPDIDVDAFTRVAETKADFVAQAVEGHAVALRIQLHVDAPSAPVRA